MRWVAKLLGGSRKSRELGGMLKFKLESAKPLDNWGLKKIIGCLTCIIHVDIYTIYLIIMVTQM